MVMATGLLASSHARQITSFAHAKTTCHSFLPPNTPKQILHPFLSPSSTPSLSSHSLFSWPSIPLYLPLSPLIPIAPSRNHSSQSPRGPSALSVGALLFPTHQTLKYRRKVMAGRTENPIPLVMMSGSEIYMWPQTDQWEFSLKLNRWFGTERYS